MLALASLLVRLRDDPGTVGKRYELDARTSTPARLPAVRRLPGVRRRRAALPAVGAPTPSGSAEPVRLIAYPGDHTRFEAPPLASGRRLRAAGEAEVGLGLADALGLRPGSTLAVQLAGGDEIRFRVVGVVRALENEGRVAYVRDAPLLAGRAAAPAGDRDPPDRRRRPRRASPPACARSGAAPHAGRRRDHAQRRLPRHPRRRAARRRARDRARVPVRARPGARDHRARAARRGRAAAGVPARDGRRSALVLAGAALAVAVPAALAGVVLERVVLGPLVARARRRLRALRWRPAPARSCSSSAALLALAAVATALVARRVHARADRRGAAGGVMRAARPILAVVALRSPPAAERAAGRPAAGLHAAGDARRPRRRRRASSAARASRCATAASSAAAAGPAPRSPPSRQLTDTHVRDEESPARVPFLDRLGGAVHLHLPPAGGADHAGARRRGRARSNRARPQAVRGHRRHRRLAQAQRARPGARGARRRARATPTPARRGYDGVQEATTPTRSTTGPDNDAPRHPGLLDAAAARRSRAPGLDAPWYPVIGNHDLLAAGRGAADARDRGASPPATGWSSGSTRAACRAAGDERDAGGRRAAPPTGAAGRTARSPPTRAGATCSPPSCSRGSRRAARRRRGGARLDYTFDIGPSVRGIVLDIVDRAGGSRGRRHAGAARVAARRAAPRRRPLRRRLLPPAAEHRTAARPRCARSTPRRTSSPRSPATATATRSRRAPRARYWLIDDRLAGRLPAAGARFRLVAHAGGGVALETWMVDQDGAGLAGVSRELAYLDAQGGRPQGFAGRPQDRNARLTLPLR